MKKPLALIILDGYGNNESVEGNAIKAAYTPNMDNYMSNYPNTYIFSSGENVGLPDGQMGNSEVGHTNIGAGRVVYQELVRITKSIQNGDILNNQAILNAINHCKKNSSALHLMGLLSNGGVHSHINHLYGLLDMAKKNKIEKVYIHAFMDGRDVSPTSGLSFIQECNQKCKEIGVGKIATISGRYYSMDRDNAWDRTEKAYNAIVIGEGVKNNDPIDIIKNSYNQDITDEFIIPSICDENGMVNSNDSIIFFNFRPDRARQLTRAFVDNDFNGFVRKSSIDNILFVCLTQYDATMPNVEIAFKNENLKNTFGEYISKKGLSQLRIAETQKYAHVTFFFNGGIETVFEGEDRILIKSPDVATFDLKPEMSAYEVTDAVTTAINSQKYDVIILNYANCDMVGHTGIFDAAKQAVEHVDKCLGKVIDAITQNQGIAIITADHGNAEKMYADDGISPFTPHTTFSVPFVVIGKDCELKDNGRLADIAPTMCELLGLDKPIEMDGESLIK